jgi:zinc protease
MREPVAAVFTDKEAVDVISIYALTPYEDLPDTAANRRDKSALGLAIAIVNRRLALLADGATPPFRSAGLVQSDLVETAEMARASAAVRAGEWRQGLAAVEREWRRALLHGFTTEEVAEQVSALRAGQTDAARSAAARSTGQLAAQLMGSINANAVFSTPAAALARIESWAPGISPEQLQAVFRRYMAVERPLFFLSTSLPQAGAETAIPLAWAKEAKKPVAAPVPKIARPFAYTDFGPPGRVVEDRRRADIDVRLVTFANNVRLNLKRTTFEPGIVRVSLRIAGGAVGLEDAPFGLASLMEAFSSGGLEAHSMDDLRSLLSGRKVQTGFSASPTAFGAVYTTTPADLELQLDVAAAYLTHPGYRPEAERRWRESLALSLLRLDSDASSAFASHGARLLTDGDKRFGREVSDGLANRSFVELKAYLEPWLAHGAIEIAIVGDIDEPVAINAVAKTFGALPRRDAVFPAGKSARPVRFRNPQDAIVLSHSGEPGQALVNIYWHVDIDPDAEPQAVRILSALAGVMRIKIIERIREDLGASYSPSASFTASDSYPGLAYFVAGAEVKPDDADKVAASLHAIAADLRDGKISDDEFTRAVAPTIDQLPLHATSNAYWLALIAQAQSEPARMERSELPALEASARAVTRDEIVAAARRWLSDDRAQDVRVMPGFDTRSAN